MSDEAANLPRKTELKENIRFFGTCLGIITAGEKIVTIWGTQAWMKYYVVALGLVLALVLVKSEGESLKSFSRASRDATSAIAGQKATEQAARPRQSLIAALYFLSLLFTLNLRLAAGPGSMNLLAQLLTNAGVSLFGSCLFFFVPRVLGWRGDSPQTWPLYRSSYLLGFTPAVVALVLVLRVVPEALYSFYLLALILTGAFFTYVLGYSHPKNVAYDLFVAKVILVASIAIAILLGILGLGWGIAATTLMRDANLGFMVIAWTLYTEFTVVFFGLVVAYRYQYQARAKVDASERGSLLIWSRKRQE